MNEDLCLLDTDTVSYILRRQHPVYSISQDYLQRHHSFFISCITYYECTRGYKAIRATKRLQIFTEFLTLNEVIYLDQAIFDKGAEIYCMLKPKGIVIGDFDLLIGATAIVRNLKLVTNNEKHFQAIQSHFPLQITNWMKPPTIKS
jgi:tRNA(fMet)-specific endonuclease VapC